MKIAKRYLVNGEWITVREGAKKYGLRKDILYVRLAKGWEPERAFTTATRQAVTPPRHYACVVDGKTLDTNDAAQMLGLTTDAIHMRVMKGWSVEKAMTTPKQTTKNVKHSIKGEMLTMKEACEKYGTSLSVVNVRVNSYGWSREDACTTAVCSRTPPLVKLAVRKSAAKQLGVRRQVIDYRIKHGWPIEAALTLPKGSKKP